MWIRLLSCLVVGVLVLIPTEASAEPVEETVRRIMALLEEDREQGSAVICRELRKVESINRFQVCSSLLGQLSHIFDHHSHKLRSIDLPELDWPKTVVPSTDDAFAAQKAKAAQYLSASESDALAKLAIVASQVRALVECAEGGVLPTDPEDSRRTSFTAHAQYQLKKLATFEKLATTRTEVIPRIAEAYAALHEIATKPQDGKRPDDNGDNLRLLSAAKVAITRCHQHMKDAPENVRNDYRNAVLSIASLSDGAPSPALQVLGKLSPDLVFAEVEDAEARLPEDAEHERLIIMNRLTRDPANISLLRDLCASVVGPNALADADSVNAARTVLATAVYRVEEIHIPEILARLEQMEQIPEPQVPNQQDVVVEAVDVDAEVKAAQTTLQDLQGRLSRFLESRAAMAHATERLSELLSEETAAKEQIEGVNRILLNFIEAEQVRNTLHYLGASTARLEELKRETWPESHLDEAVAILNASDQMLGSLWGISASSTHGEVKDRCEELPRLLAQYRDEILYARSRAGLQAIQDNGAACGQAEKQALEKQQFNESIKGIESLIRDSERAFIRMPSIRAQQESQNSLQEMQASLMRLKREQLNRYQHVVVNRCNQVLSQFDDKWYVTEKVALSLFHSQALAEVDQSLLTPEVSRCFNDCIGKLFSKMTPKVLVECESRMGRPEGKLKLETF